MIPGPYRRDIRRLVEERTHIKRLLSQHARRISAHLEQIKALEARFDAAGGELVSIEALAGTVPKPLRATTSLSDAIRMGD